MPGAVLVAELEPETGDYLGRQLRDDGFDVLGAARRSEALDLAERARPDLVLLAELELCLRLRRGEPGRTWDRNVPVIVLAQSSDPVDRVRALDRGADDVIGRPFAYEELLARIRAVLRRASSANGEVLVADELVVDRRTRRVSVRNNVVPLSAKEFELLARLAAEPSRVFTKEELLRQVWGFRALGRTRTLESHASRLRRKLNIGEGDHFVVNVWGGWRAVWRPLSDGGGMPGCAGDSTRRGESATERSRTHSEPCGRGVDAEKCDPHAAELAPGSASRVTSGLQILFRVVPRWS
jgi:DNA-binding response OmpR family regulator